MSLTEQRDLNPVSPENLLNPVPYYKELRESHPVHWSPELNAWLITRHADVSACFRDSRFSANRLAMYKAGAGPLADTVLRDYLGLGERSIMMKDGKEHTRMRRHTMPAFTPEALGFWRPTIYRTIETLVGRVQNSGQMDLVTTISHHFPPMIIAEVLGIPESDREMFQVLSEPLAQFQGPGPGVDMMEVARKANQAAKDLFDYLLHHIEKLRRNPGQDALSQIIHSQTTGGHMDDAELATTSTVLLTAGHLTTTDQLSNGVYDLLTHPDQLQLLREDFGLLPSAVNEMLRYTPALSFFHRIAVEDVQLHGKTIHKGNVVFLGMAAANRDPAFVEEPDRFDITRDFRQSPPMSFGHGPHHCLGAGLARRELEIALEVLLQRLPGLRLDEQKAPKLKTSNLVFRGFAELPLKWSPA